MVDIFVVDDDQDNIFLIKHALKSIKTPHCVRFFSNAPDCLRALETHKPDLIVMDLVMPGMNGHEATRIIKGNPIHEQISVYIFSTSDSKADIKTSFEAGAVAHVIKALDFKEVVKQLSAIIKTENTSKERLSG